MTINIKVTGCNVTMHVATGTAVAAAAEPVEASAGLPFGFNRPDDDEGDDGEGGELEGRAPLAT